jgi:hypothetical protein
MPSYKLIVKVKEFVTPVQKRPPKERAAASEPVLNS